MQSNPICQAVINWSCHGAICEFGHGSSWHTFCSTTAQCPVMTLAFDAASWDQMSTETVAYHVSYVHGSFLDMASPVLVTYRRSVMMRSAASSSPALNAWESFCRTHVMFNHHAPGLHRLAVFDAALPKLTCYRRNSIKSLPELWKKGDNSTSRTTGTAYAPGLLYCTCPYSTPVCSCQQHKVIAATASADPDQCITKHKQ